MTDPSEEHLHVKRTWLQWFLRPWTMVSFLCLFLVMLSPFAFRAWRLSMVLNVKDFDRQPLIAESLKITPANNAATDFRIAISKKSPLTSYTEASYDSAVSYTDSGVPEPYLTWLNDNQDALQAWKLGTTKEYFAEFELQDTNFYVLLPVSQESRDFARLMLLEAAQEYNRGNINNALDWHATSFRSGLIVGKHGMLIQKLVSISSLYLVMQKGIVPLIAVDRLDEAALVEFQSQLQADFKKLHSPTSVILKTEAIIFHNTHRDSTASQLLSDFGNVSTGGMPDSLLNIGMYFAAEPQLSARIHRQVMANLLTECDLPYYQRTVVTGSYCKLYAPSSTSYIPGMMTPEDINRVAELSLVKELAPSFNHFQTAVDRFDAKWAALNAAFILERYRRRHGSYPTSLSELDADLKSELPLDPFTGKELIMKVNPTGPPSIYSVGNNLSDNSGDFENQADSGFQLGAVEIKPEPIEQ